MGTQSRRNLLRGVLFVAALVIAALIYYFSSQDGNESSELSRGVSRFILRLFVPGYDDLPRREQYAHLKALGLYVRKCAHFTEYAVFAAVLENYLRLRLPSGSVKLSATLGWLIATLYAGTDELHQMFVAGRGPALLDVGIDSAGALTGVLIAAAVLSARLKRKKG